MRHLVYKLYPLLALLVLLGCAQDKPVEPPESSAEGAGSIVVQTRLEPVLDRLNRQLSVRPEAVWTSVPYGSEARLEVLTLSHGGQDRRGEWKVEGSLATPDNTFARELENLPEFPTRLELETLVPVTWLPRRRVEQPQPEVTLTPAPTPEATPLASEGQGVETEPEPEEVAVANDVAPAPPPPPKLHLNGVMAGDVNTAFFQLGDRKISLKPGETKAGVTLHSVAPQTAVITYKGKRREMQVAMPLEAQMRRPPRLEEKKEAGEPEHIYLDNSSLDRTPPKVLKNGVRKL